MPGPNSRTSSVIMAYWPSRGSSLNNIYFCTMQVGVVQYFIRHILSYHESNEKKEEKHIFAYVRWKERHPHYNWFGVSALTLLRVLVPVVYCQCKESSVGVLP